MCAVHTPSGKPFQTTEVPRALPPAAVDPRLWETVLSLIPQKFSSAWWNHELPKGRATPLPSPGCPQRQHEAHELTQRGQPAHR